MMLDINSSTIIISDARLLTDDSLHTIVLRNGKVDSITSAPGTPLSIHSENDSPPIHHIQANGQVAITGMCDLYTRLREPGLTRKGSIASESQAALASGFTQVLCAPDTLPAIDNVATVELIRQRAQLAKGASVLPMAALTIGLEGAQLSELSTLRAAGCPAAGQADNPLDSTNVLFSAMEYAASFDLPLFMTARHAQLGADGCAHTGAIATRLGLPGIPVAAETLELARLLEITRETGCRLHISRISSARGVHMIEEAKQSALPVTCDVGLHHLFFSDDQLHGYDASFHSAVPFRDKKDRDALRAGVKTGVIDAICTDHSPHDIDAGLAPFPATEPGLSAYQWAIPLILQLPTLLELPLIRVFEKLIDAPRRILNSPQQVGLEQGHDAEFFLLSPETAIDQNPNNNVQTGLNHPLNVHSASSIGLLPLCGKVSHAFLQNRWHRF